jgi:hypothetical protein
MNILSAGVLLLSAGALALTALPSPDIGPGLVAGAAAAASPPVKQEEAAQQPGEGGPLRPVRVVLASPYGPHTERARELPKREEKAVDTTVVSALPEREAAPAFANDPSNHPAKFTSAPRSQRPAEARERSRYEKAKPSTLARIDGGQSVPLRPVRQTIASPLSTRDRSASDAGVLGDLTDRSLFLAILVPLATRDAAYALRTCACWLLAANSAISAKCPAAFLRHGLSKTSGKALSS